MTRRVLLDTSFLIALENRSDPHHQRAKDLDRELIAQNAMLVLHGGILMEIGDGYARLGRRGKANDLFQRLLNEDRYRIEPFTQRLLDDGCRLTLVFTLPAWYNPRELQESRHANEICRCEIRRCGSG